MLLDWDWDWDWDKHTHTHNTQFSINVEKCMAAIIVCYSFYFGLIIS